jgi:hypothetical protein
VNALETYDWVDTTNLSQLVAHFARAQMLVALFDGDPKKWIDFLDENGTPEERRSEIPVAQDYCRRAASDPAYIERLRAIVSEFSRLVAA